MINPSNFFDLDEELVDSYILKLQEILNASDNWDDDVYWSLPLIIENLWDGHFDIDLYEKDNSLIIFGVYIDDVNEEIKNILTKEGEMNSSNNNKYSLDSEVEILLSIGRSDFEFWKESIHKDFTWYHVGIEGYIGLQTLEDFISLYTTYTEKLYEYLIDNGFEYKEKNEGWNPIYQKRAMEICYENDCYWIFLDGFKDTQPWECYHYLKDVIKEIEEFINKK